MLKRYENKGAVVNDGRYCINLGFEVRTEADRNMAALIQTKGQCPDRKCKHCYPKPKDG